MKLHYVREWTAEISDDIIKKEIWDYKVAENILTKRLNHVEVYLLKMKIIDKYTPYNSNNVPHAFTKPLADHIKNIDSQITIVP